MTDDDQKKTLDETDRALRGMAEWMAAYILTLPERSRPRAYDRAVEKVDALQTRSGTVLLEMLAAILTETASAVTIHGLSKGHRSGKVHETTALPTCPACAEDYPRPHVDGQDVTWCGGHLHAEGEAVVCDVCGGPS